MKKLALVLTWLVATVVAVGVAWAGVSVVDNQVIDPSPALGAAAVDGESSTTVPPAPATSAEPPTSPTSSPTSSSAPAGSAPAGSAPASSVPSSSTPPSSPVTVTTPANAGTPSTGVPAAPSAPASSTQTFTLIGGTAAFSFSASGVQVLWATPNPGFTVKIEPEQPGFKVEFRSDAHRSRVDAWWSGGPRHEIREEPRD